MTYKEYMENFDATTAKNKIVEWIRKWFAANAPENAIAVVGISGGKDSSVVAALCAEALGRERVFGLLMPCAVQTDIQYAYDLCNFLNINFNEIDIFNLYTLASYYVEQLCEHCTEQTKINLKPRLRMTMLYAFSQSLNGRVACTDNLSESYVGYSTQWGDNVGDFAPIANYTSDEVIAICHALGLPEKFLIKPPSDGLSGKTDEEAFGFTYQQLNEYIRLNRCNDKETREKIDARHNSTEFKRKPIASFRY